MEEFFYLGCFHAGLTILIPINQYTENGKFIFFRFSHCSYSKGEVIYKSMGNEITIIMVKTLKNLGIPGIPFAGSSVNLAKTMRTTGEHYANKTVPDPCS